MNSPSTHGPDGRDGRGRFKPGNKLGKGNPLAGRAARIRAILLDRMDDKTAAKIADALVKKAKAGDLAFARELLDRTIGKPSPTELLERVAHLERVLAEREENNRDSQ